MIKIDNKIMKKLIEWKNNKSRKPLILRGSKQISKIDWINQFGNENYEEIAYFNFNDNIELNNLFQSPEDPIKILDQLALIYGKTIIPEKTLIVFDEIQKCPKMLNSLKYFYEQANEYSIICTGSSLGKILSARSFAVGNVQLLDI